VDDTGGRTVDQYLLHHGGDPLGEYADDGEFESHMSDKYFASGRVVMLASKKWIVEIPVPKESGSQSFIYRWGQPKAQVGEHSVQVSYGPRGGV
jgi:hypothetical protein